MSKNEINNIQDFLTIIKDNENIRYQIVNVQLLLRRHPPEAVIGFVTELHKDYTKQLRRMIRKENTYQFLNDIISTKFRVKMAIKTLKKYCNKGDKAA